MEGRHRVKEQLKKLGAFEFFNSSFSYIDNETGEEHFVGVPEEGGRNAISTDPLAPGTVYAASVDEEGKVGLYRIEVGMTPGSGKLKLAGGISGEMKESIQRAFGYLQGNKVKFGIPQALEENDFLVQAIDLIQSRPACECGVALLVAVVSAVRKMPVAPAMVVVGDLSIQGNIRGARTIVEICRLAMENGARRILVPPENKRDLLEVSGDVAERLDPVFYGDPSVAVQKALTVV